MDSERELLEWAAKAAGIDAEWHDNDNADFEAQHEGMYLKGARSPDNSKYWNPLTSDGDALRLAVKCLNFYKLKYTAEDYEHCNQDGYAATRRAIVRAAAMLAAAKEEVK